MASRVREFNATRSQKISDYGGSLTASGSRLPKQPVCLTCVNKKMAETRRADQEVRRRKEMKEEQQNLMVMKKKMNPVPIYQVEKSKEVNMYNARQIQTHRAQRQRE